MDIEKTAIYKAVQIVGGPSALAKKLQEQGVENIDRRKVWTWVHRQHRVPACYIKAVCIATNMRVTVNALMDDHSN